MSLRLNIFGEQYNDQEPCFLVADNGLVWNRVSGKWFTEKSLKDLAKAKGYTFEDGEIGAPSDAWQARDNSGQEWKRAKAVKPETKTSTPEKATRAAHRKSGDKK